MTVTESLREIQAMQLIIHLPWKEMMHMLGVPGACPVITEVNSSSVNSVLPPRSCSAYFMNSSFIAFSLLKTIPKKVGV